MQRIDCSSRPDSSAPLTDERKGSVLILVIALLGMLLLLGIAFYSFAAQEHVSAGYFAETYKERLPGLSAETLFDYGLEQLIVGPAETQKQSALYGRTHSLVGNMLGINANTVSGGFFDPIPYNGQGVNLALNGTNGPIVDQDYDGTDDGLSPEADPLMVNLSAAANLSLAANATETNPFTANRPQPDVGYTYPDINNLFLAHISEPTEDVNGRRVIIPSFHRPQILRDPSGAISATWPEDMGLEGKVLRPHPAHKIAGSGTLRFITSSTPETNVLGNPVNPFPFTVGSGRMGVWTGNSDTEYDFDADNDNDGINEGIWLDLGFPAQTLIDGRRYVPLFSFTVQDADGLINLNTAGNLNEHFVGTGNYGDASSPDMQNLPISTSHLGASRTEVNPQWALWDWTSGNLTADQQKEFKYFSGLTGTMSRTAIANMELIHIKNGQKRDDGTGGDEYNVGAWGELSALQMPGGFASPGQPNVDDDTDFDPMTSKTAGSPNSDPLLKIISTLPFPAAGTPLDLRGFGTITAPTPGPNGLIANLSAGAAGDPNRWLKFENYLDDSEWSVPMGGDLATPYLDTNTQIDEADETIVEPLLADSNPTIQEDELFGPDEMPGLHLTNSEFTSVAGTSRLRKLAPINFAGEAVRKQFTTTSFDRAEFSWPINHARPWEQNLTTGELFPYTNDPFRTELRNFLSMPHRFKLVLNGLLQGVNPDNRPVYQALTPYPTDYSAGGAAAQTVLATQERQALAKDLYCLLYSVGGGVDVDYSTTSGSALYNPTQLAEIAQFAVNVIDSMDRDNVITEFAYDTDLSDGWSPGTLKVYGVEAQELTLSEWLSVRIPYAGTGNPDHPVTRYDDTAIALDPVGTVWTYIELKSVSPRPVKLDGWGWRIRKEGIGGTRYLTLHGGTGAEIAQGGTYLIGSTSQPELNTATTKYYSSDLRIDYDKNLGSNLNSFNRILPRDIETTESSIPSPSNVISPPPASDLDLVYDYAPGDTPSDKFVVSSDASATPGPVGDFFKPTTIPSPSGTETVRLILERRVNLQAVVNQGVSDPSNPWVAVDQMVIEPAKAVQPITLAFADNTLDDETALRFAGGSLGNGKLRDFVSHERREPLDRSDASAEGDSTAGAGGTAGSLDFSPNSTFNATNSISPTAFTLWQAHFDREFSSAFELLSIPLYGPPESSTLSFDTDGLPVDSGSVASYSSYLLDGVTTNRLKQSQDMTESLLTVSTPSMGMDDEYRGVELIAAKKFLRPDYEDDGDVTKAKFDNRWYRLLDLVDVPTQTNQVVQWEHNGIQGTQWPNPDAPSRLPGAINLNTIRHRGVLAGLIDDPSFHMDPAADFPDLITLPQPQSKLLNMLSDPNESRDWWAQMIQARDQVDPVTSMILPGLPNSSPYRFQGVVDRINEDTNGNGVLDMGEDTNMNLSLDFDSPNVLIKQTLLRDLGIDGANPDRRNLFEARTSGAATEVDYHTRHRLLRKIANNSTNRSNVFIVWMTVGFFEGVDDATSGGVRIGAKLTALPEHRGFFIVDRTLLEEAEIEDSTNGVRFDYKKFILYRKTLK